MSHVLKEDHSKEVMSAATDAIRSRWEKQVNEEATIATVLLSMETDETKIGRIDDIRADKALRFIASFGSKYLSFYELSKQSEDDLRALLLVQMGWFNNRVNRFKGLESEIRETKVVRGGEWSPLDVWNTYSMELGMVARALLTVTASEAAVERTFSAQDSIHTKRRNLLADEAVQAEMFLKFNNRAMKKMFLPSHSETELSEEFEPLHVDVATQLMPEMEEEELEIEEVLVEETEEEEEKEEEDEEEEEEESKEKEEASAASASALPSRTQSSINRDGYTFLISFIRDHHLDFDSKLTSNVEMQLEADAVNRNVGGYTLVELKKQLKYVLKHCREEYMSMEAEP